MTSGRLKSERKPAPMIAAAFAYAIVRDARDPVVTRLNARHATLAGPGKPDEANPTTETLRVSTEIYLISCGLVRYVEVCSEAAVLSTVALPG